MASASCAQEIHGLRSWGQMGQPCIDALMIIPLLGKKSPRRQQVQTRRRGLQVVASHHVRRHGRQEAGAHHVHVRRHSLQGMVAQLISKLQVLKIVLPEKWSTQKQNAGKPALLWDILLLKVFRTQINDQPAAFGIKWATVTSTRC